MNNIIYDLANEVLAGNLSREEAFAKIQEKAVLESLSAEEIEEIFLLANQLGHSNPRLLLMVHELLYVLSKHISFNPYAFTIMVTHLGTSYMNMNMPELSQKYLNLALELARKHQNRELQITTLTNLATVYGLLEQLENMEATVDQALLICQSVKDIENQALLLARKGSLMRRKGRKEEAFKIYKEGLSLIRQSNNLGVEAGLLGNMANLLTELEKWEEAIEYYKRGIEISKRAGDFQRGAQIASNLGNTYQDLKRYEEAISSYVEAAHIAQQGQYWLQAAVYMDEVSIICGDIEDSQRELRYLTQAVEFAKLAGDTEREIYLLRKLAGTQSQLRQWDVALNTCHVALNIARESGAHSDQILILTLIRSIYLDRGDVDNVEIITQQLVKLAFAVSDSGFLYLSRILFQDAYPICKVAQSVLSGETTIQTAMNSIQNDSALEANHLTAALEMLSLMRSHSTNLRAAYVLGRLIEPKVSYLLLERKGFFYEKIGIVCQMTGRLQEALDYFHSGLELSTQSDDQAAIASFWLHIGTTYRQMGLLAKAKDTLEQTLTLMIKLQDEPATAITLGNLGNTYADLEEFEGALNCYEQALKIHKKHHDRSGEGLIILNIGELYIRQQKWESAIAPLEEALSILNEYGEYHYISNAYSSLARAYSQLEHAEKAQQNYEKAIALCRQIGNVTAEAGLLNHLGLEYKKSGQLGRALASFEAVLNITEQMGNYPLASEIAEKNIGMTYYHELEDYPKAIAALEHSLEIEVGLGRVIRQIHLMLTLSEFYREAGQEKEANHYGAEAIKALHKEWKKDKPDQIDSILEQVWSLLEELSLTDNLEEVAMRFVEQHPHLRRESRSGLVTLFQNITEWIVSKGIIGLSFEGNLRLLTDLIEKNSKPLEFPIPSSHPNVAEDLEDIVFRFANLTLQLDISRREELSQVLSFIEDNPELLSDEADKILSQLSVRLREQENQYVAVTTCRSLLARCRKVGRDNLHLKVMGLPTQHPQELLDMLKGPNSMTTDSDDESSYLRVLTIELDGERASFRIPNGMNMDELRKLTGIVFQKNFEIKDEDFEEVYNDSNMELIDMWVQQAKDQGAKDISNRLLSIRYFLKRIQRLQIIFNAIDLDEFQTQIYNNIENMLSFVSWEDRWEIARNHPELLSDEALIVLEKIINNAPDDGFRNRVAMCYEKIVAWREQQKSQLENNSAENALATWCDSQIYQLAESFRLGRLSIDDLGQHIARITEDEVFLALQAPVDQLIALDPIVTFNYFRIAYDKSIHMNSSTQIDAGYLVSLVAIKSGGGYRSAIAVLYDVWKLIENMEVNRAEDLKFRGMVVLNLGTLFDYTNQIQDAIPLYQSALELFRSSSNWSYRALCLNNLGTAYKALYQIDMSLNHYKKALTIRQNLGQKIEAAKLYNQMGELLRDTHSAQEALAHHQKALELYQTLQDQQRKAYTLDKMALAYRQLRQPYKARDLLKEAIEIYQEIGNTNGVAISTANWGNVECDLGNTAEGLAYYQQALEMVPNASDWDQAIWISDQGVAYYEINQTDRAVEKWQQALSMHQQVGNERMEASCLANLATVDQERGRLSEAISKAEEALRLMKKTKDLWRQTGVLCFLGRLHTDLGDVEKAGSFYNEALENSRLTGDRLEEATVLADMAKLDLRFGEGKQTRPLLEQALSLSTDLDPRLQASILISLAEYYAIEQNDRVQAMRLAQQSIELVERLRRELPRSEQRLSFFGQFSDFYEELVTLFIRLGFYAQAFHYCERMKTRTLGDMIFQQEVLPTHGPPELIDEYLKLTQQVKHSFEVSSENDHRILQNALSNVIAQLKQYDPEFVALEEGQVVELSAIKNQLPSHAVLIEFAVLKEGTVIFLIPGRNVTPSKEISFPLRPGTDHSGLPSLDSWTDELGLHVLILPDFSLQDLSRLLAEQNTGWLSAYRSYLNERTPAKRKACFDVLDQMLYQLQERLLRNVLQTLQKWAAVQELIFIPHRGLHLIPLHAAWWHELDALTNRPLARQYLSDLYTISYAPSATIWNLSQRRPVPNEIKLVAIDDPRNDLKYSIVEVESISALLPAQDVTLIRGKNSTISNIVQASKTATYLHFSCHGNYRWAKPLDSALMLADAPFKLSHIFQTMNVAEGGMIVLSACETGLTDYADLMDEYIGLPSGFLYSGASTVVSTLWAVNEFSTALLIGRMYKNHLQAQMSVSDALRDAQKWLRNLTSADLLTYAENALSGLMSAEQVNFPPEMAQELLWVYSLDDPYEKPFEHPYYWAGFIVVGSGLEGTQIKSTLQEPSLRNHHAPKFSISQKISAFLGKLKFWQQ